DAEFLADAPGDVPMAGQVFSHQHVAGEERDFSVQSLRAAFSGYAGLETACLLCGTAVRNGWACLPRASAPVCPDRAVGTHAVCPVTAEPWQHGWRDTCGHQSCHTASTVLTLWCRRSVQAPMPGLYCTLLVRASASRMVS